MLAEALDVPRERLRLVHREPLGSGVVVGFEVPEPGGSTFAYFDSSGLAVPAETGLVAPGVGRVWTHPMDPHVPALAPAAFGDAATVLLARLGITAAGSPEIVAYRPGRRAVLRVPTTDGSAWVKVVRPRRAERIAATHATLRDAGIPVPKILGWSPAGLLVIEEAAGVPVSDADWDADELLAAVDELRQRIARVPAPRASTTDMVTRADWYRARLGERRPDLLPRVEAVLTATHADDPAPTTTIHGDLHFGQLFVDPLSPHRITALIDVDTTGTGAAAEDPAAFLAHAVASTIQRASAASESESSGRAVSLAAAAHARWGADRHVRQRAVAQLLGHTLGAAEHGDDDRAVRLLHAAERIAAGDAPVDIDEPSSRS